MKILIKRFSQTGDEDQQIAKGFARGSSNSFDKDKEEDFENKRNQKK